ncbi:MAG TPA: WSC domain-containing protein, partial [Anaeromyxobacteraceae bacterium]|nr:WSC domain-containing protein [Anaeromyxobacteraceae bacterium]
MKTVSSRAAVLGPLLVVLAGQSACGGSQNEAATADAVHPAAPEASVVLDSTGSPAFALMSEMYGDAGSVAQQRMSEGLLDGATFHPSLTSSEQNFVVGNRAPFAYFSIPSTANVGSCYPSSSSNDGSMLASLTQQVGYDVWRFAMPEFDQGGGCWASGRPSVAGMSDSQAYSTWTGFYLNTKQLASYLSQTAQQRGYKWLSSCSFAFCPQYAYDMGADTVLVERNEDEMSGITPGLAMIRGAAKQHGGKDWGVDISTWRYWSNGATVYSGGNLVTGWSTATFKRNMYIAYMGGANIIHDEAADYTSGATGGASLNPLGQTVQAFHNFAVTRHSNRGTPYVPVAFMQDHYSGLEPKFGEWMQGDAKWYWTNSYSQGDKMFSNLLSVAYPNYNTWGTLPSGAPKVLNSDGSINVSATFSAYQQALRNRQDPRPWEPFGSSRWGETVDIITNQAPLAALQNYKAIVLATGTTLTSGQVSTLTQYVQQGGILVVNAKQLPASSGSSSPAPSGNVYEGCYTDSSTRALPNELMSSGATVESCIAAAKARGYAYAGVQYYGQCFAGNTPGFSKVADSQCNEPCSANSSEMCGGFWRNSIYATTSTSSTGGGIEALTGLHLTTSRSSATSETWVADGSTLSEPSYNYTIGTPTTASVIAQVSGHPIVTKNVVGAGAVYVTTPDLMEDAHA